MFEHMDVRVRAGPFLLRSAGRTLLLRDAAASHRRVSGANGLTPGLLPCALRVSFAVRAAPAAQWLLLPKQK